jgi:hypothetical protein
LLTRQIKVVTRSTGRLPKAVCIGTLWWVSMFGSFETLLCKGALLVYVPDEVTEAEHQNTYSSELDDTSEVGVEGFYQISRHGV